MFFSPFEDIVLLLSVKVTTFVLYPMFRFQEIVKDLNAIESFAFDDGIVRSMPNKSK